MLRNAELDLLKYLGKFNTTTTPTDVNEYGGQSVSGFANFIPQNEAFFLTSAEFTWFVESWEIGEDIGTGKLRNKKLYPAKVTGLNIPSFWDSQSAVTWKDSLVYGFQPGFGQAIPEDANRPDKTVPRITIDAPTIQNTTDPLNIFNLGAFGRLLSIASWVDPTLAEEYDALEDGEFKEKSPNSIDYNEYPVNYPPYDIYVPQGYYY
jgi:hypothetical protein